MELMVCPGGHDDGAIEISTSTLEKNVGIMVIPADVLRDLMDECTQDGAAEPDYDLMASEIVESLKSYGLLDKDGRMAPAIYRFIAPGPTRNPQTDFVWEA